MATVQTNIEKALLDRVKSLVLVPPLPVAWPNVDFPGKTSTGVAIPMPASYIRVQHFPNKNERIHLGSTDPYFRQGFIQLTVVGQRNKGTLAAMEVAGKVAEHFPADLALYSEGVRVKIASAPDVAPPLETDVSWDVPVTVYYEVFA